MNISEIQKRIEELRQKETLTREEQSELKQLSFDITRDADIAVNRNRRTARVFLDECAG